MEGGESEGEEGVEKHSCCCNRSRTVRQKYRPRDTIYVETNMTDKQKKRTHRNANLFILTATSRVKRLRLSSSWRLRITTGHDVWLSTEPCSCTTDECVDTPVVMATVLARGVSRTCHVLIYRPN